MKKVKKKNILIDSNVLIDDFLARNGGTYKPSQKVVEALEVLSKKFTLMIPSFSITQMISKLQPNRGKKYPVADIERELRYVVKKYNLIFLSDRDVIACADGIKGIKNVDIEDYLVYVLASKMQCSYIITENTKDFANFNIRSLKPRKYFQLY